MRRSSNDRAGHGLSSVDGVDEGWGRKAVEFATLSEPGNFREYVAGTIGWASMPGTGCWMWRAGPGSRSS